MGLRSAWRASRLRHRWMTEDAVVRESLTAHRAPDATLDEVGVPGEDVGFTGEPIHSELSNGYGTGDPSSPSWAGYGGGGATPS